MADKAAQEAFIAAGGVKRDRKAEAMTRRRNLGSSLPKSSQRQEVLDAIWSALREMYIWVAKTFNLEEQMFRCEECGRWCPPKHHGYASPEGYWGQADHEIPRTKSGHYTARNFSWKCSIRDDSCHSRKHNNDVRWTKEGA